MNERPDIDDLPEEGKALVDVISKAAMKLEALADGRLLLVWPEGGRVKFLEDRELEMEVIRVQEQLHVAEFMRDNALRRTKELEEKLRIICPEKPDLPN